MHGQLYHLVGALRLGSWQTRSCLTEHGNGPIWCRLLPADIQGFVLRCLQTSVPRKFPVFCLQRLQTQLYEPSLACRHMPSFSKGLPTERLCQPVSSTQLQADGIKARRHSGKRTYRNERSEKSCTATSGQIQFSGGSGSVTFSQAEEQAEPMVQPVVWAQRYSLSL